MTKRSAILIASPTANTSMVRSKEPLHGTFNDIDNWKRFLQHPIGGCWLDEEIYDLSGDNRQFLFEIISKLKDVDYVFLAYSGHGYTDNRDDFIFMNYGNDVVSVKEIQNAICDAKSDIKGTLIFDSCRCLPKKEVFISERKSSLNESIDEELLSISRKQWDNLFKDVKSQGLVTIQTCKRYQESYMKHPCFDKSIYSWFMYNEGFCSIPPLNVGAAFQSASPKTTSEAQKVNKKIQEPQCDNETADYPFSLGKGETCINQAAAICQKVYED